MKTDQLYRKFLTRWEEVIDLPPQTFGPFTPLYKAITRRLKIMPWPMLVAGGGLLVVGLYFLFGTSIIYLVTLLQRSF